MDSMMLSASIFCIMGMVAGVGANFSRDYMVVLDFLFPIHWVWLTMVGYMMTLPFHFFMPRHSVEQSSKPPLKWHHYAVCMLMDAAGMICSYWALGALSAAIAQMMRGCKLILVTGVKYCMGTRLLRHHYFGVAITMVGLAIVAAGSFMENHGAAHDGSTHRDTSDAALWQAFGLCFAAEVFFASYFVYQEYVVKSYEVTPYQLIGWMGVLGFFIVGVFLLVVDYMAYASNADVFRSLTGSQILVIVLLVYMAIQGCKMLVGVKISELTSAEVQVFVEIASCAAIWVVEIALGWVKFEVLHLIGFLIISGGMITYAGMVPFLRRESQEEALPLASPKIIQDRQRSN
eukprot:gnl/TRDRNA2_/TRDRNA2_177740_c0_seq7.p1 gnl/TRDRNA2_/TRDRNA2_177740_c0~~gnl/TRDRNA2_/TRDRNA2_177740_c0_seq7.p1  ORF type:complete len:346 (+),score=45.80 gnl/TRDRNA2_/TRDRNA2_177740_c0_seq7:280-1317(+)